MSRLHSRDLWFDRGLFLGALVAGGMVLLILGFLLRESWPVISGGRLPSLFSEPNWQPGSEQDPQYGIRTMLVSSALVTLLAGVLAIPMGVLAAIFHEYYAPPAVALLQARLLELLAGVPSVVFGFWGLTVLVPMINQWHPPGQSWLAASLVLAVMILPTVGVTACAAFQQIDPKLMRGAQALGISRPVLILQILLPAAKGGLITGCLLALTRAVGETLAVVMVCGNIARIPSSVFDPIRPVTATIALEMGYASADHRSTLFALGLILILVIGVLFALRLFWNNRSEAGTGK